MEALETYSTYKRGGDWIEKGLEEAGGIGMGYMAGLAAAGAALIFIPGPGWVILIGFAGSVGVEYLAKVGIREGYELIMSEDHQ
ncbi:MAG: hypothetical protein JSR33_06760 [Proteobacteria bacterium]|nr:hypothetical protein [Pseudomonadota bacterium]